MEVTIGKCRICVDFSFPAMLCVLLLFGDSAFLCQTLAVCVIHEAGHGVAMLLTKAGVREIRLSAAGVGMRTRSVFLSKAQELGILLSGPVMNFAAAFLLHEMQGWSNAAVLHLCMGCFNLLPFSVLDGGSALQCLFAENPRILRMQTVFCVLLSCAALVFFAAVRVYNPFLYLMCIYLAAAQLRVDKQGGMW